MSDTMLSAATYQLSFPFSAHVYLAGTMLVGLHGPYRDSPDTIKEACTLDSHTFDDCHAKEILSVSLDMLDLLSTSN